MWETIFVLFPQWACESTNQFGKILLRDAAVFWRRIASRMLGFSVPTVKSLSLTLQVWCPCHRKSGPQIGRVFLCDDLIFFDYRCTIYVYPLLSKIEKGPNFTVFRFSSYLYYVASSHLGPQPLLVPGSWKCFEVPSPKDVKKSQVLWFSEKFAKFVKLWQPNMTEDDLYCKDI